ncbi:hypothetical protein [Kribbella sp. NPDC048915]|uniref:hypothetical protein n=1 Tax=Kribbella sp. NPDC048915 TaxID=3155148 RepID=UPI0033C4447E
MTRVDHRKPPARAARRQQRERAGRTPRPHKAKRSRGAIGAAVAVGLAMVAAFAFVLTRGPANEAPADGLQLGSGTDNGAAAPPAPSTTGPETKADRQPPSATAPKTTPKAQVTTTTVDTGPTSPKFKRGQWIAMLDKYPADAGDMAKATAEKITRAGIPAKAMLVDGQYPGLTTSSLTPLTGTWVIYLGPGTSSEQILDLCLDPRTQAAYQSACPTYEPAAG